MDTVAAYIAEYVERIHYDDLPESTVHDCKTRIVDTLGCGLGAFDAEPSRIARHMALRSGDPGGAHVLGTGQRALPELAAFANGVMNRYLDGNDAFPGATGGGHPSDVIAAVLAVADAAGADGKTAITAVTVAYEIFHNLLKAMFLRDKGYDHVFHTAVASAMGAVKVLKLPMAQALNALALAVTPNLALGATRRGSLSMWKGSAAGNAGRNGVFAALLAAAGMTGPDRVVEGAHGLYDVLGKFELMPFTEPFGNFRIGQSNLKYFLAEYHALSPITAALDMYKQTAIDDIEAIAIDTYWMTWSEIGSEPEKWHPTTRETADHSLPYIIAAVLIDGRFSDSIFLKERLSDPRIHRLTDKISVREDEKFSGQFPDTVPCRITVTTRQGEKKTVEVEYPRGHTKNPMNDAEVNAKFRDLAGRTITNNRIDEALTRLWGLDTAPNLGAIFEAMKVSEDRG